MNRTLRAVLFTTLCSIWILSLLARPGLAQSHEVSGTVVDASNGETLPGVNILVKGTSRGTSTNAQGRYELSLARTDTLLFSFIGYETREVPVNGRATIDITLSPATLRAGEEVVVVGYGTQQKRDLTGSVSSVSNEEVSELPTQSVQAALQGKVAGVQITPQSGRPGAQSDVRIRGVGTLNNASPLYVVDGMLLDDISFLDPKNVESVEVLKDASATAIYGSRGANGVVIVTTKKGRSGGPQINVRSYYGLQRVNNKIDVTNAGEYAMLANESAANEGRPEVFSDPGQYGQGTDWQDLILDETAPLQSYQVSASGGNDNALYNVSGSFYQQDGVVRGSDYRRVSLRVNNEYLLADDVTLGHNVNFSYNDSQDEAGDLVNLALRADPTVPAYTDNGDFANTTVNGGSANPAASIAYNENDNYGFRTVGNVYLDADFLEHFNFRTNFGLDWMRGERKDFVPEFYVSPIQNNTTNRLTVGDSKETNWLSESTLRYQRDLGDHSLKVLTGITFQEFVSEQLQGSRINCPGNSSEFFFLNACESEGQTNTNGSYSWGMISYLFRANYSYKDRYLLTATMRRDGSSRFSSQNRWGNFPSVAAGWVISNEPFMESVSEISYLKLRGSWGVIGNDKIDTGAAIPVVTSNLNAVFGDNQNINPGATVTELANPELQWEEATQLDIGLEVGLFDDRLTAEADWYRKETNDILVRPLIPDIVGVPTAPVVNAASVLNRGIDLTLRWRYASNDFSYSIGLTGSTVHNEVLSLVQGRDEIPGGDVRNLGLTTLTTPGHPIGAFYGWRTAGVFQNQQEIDNSPTLGGEQPGDLRLADINGDGTITEEDKTFLGSPIPDYTVGLSLSASYKNLDASLDIDGQAGNQVLYARPAIRGFRLLNYDSFYLDRWTGEGTSTTQPRITESGHNYQTDRFLYDGDYLRLRNIQLGYSLPADLTSSLDVRNIRIYVNASNVLTLTDYPGYTPQIGGGSVIATGIDSGTYPVASSYTVGLELDF